MRVLIVSGIWPPDVGGPASHAPAVARYLSGRGHAVEVVTTAAAAPGAVPYPVHWTPRRLPRGLRHAHGLGLVARRARGADVVYTTGMFARSGVGARLAGRPYVLKLTGDPAFERVRGWGSVKGDVEDFQRGAGGLGSRALRLLRDRVLRGADHVFVPSAYLRELALRWGVEPDRVSVLPNPAPAAADLDDSEGLWERFGGSGLTLAFAGRVTAQKALDVLLRALGGCEDVNLVIAGEGDELPAVRRLVAELGLADRVHLAGPLEPREVLSLFAAADAAVLSSTWENFPHSVVEALAAGTPVIATAVGGVPEVVRDGVNGLLVPAGDDAALAGAIGRFASDATLRATLRANAAASVARYAPERIFAELETALLRAAR